MPDTVFILPHECIGIGWDHGVRLGTPLKSKGFSCPQPPAEVGTGLGPRERLGPGAPTPIADTALKLPLGLEEDGLPRYVDLLHFIDGSDLLRSCLVRDRYVSLAQTQMGTRNRRFGGESGILDMARRSGLFLEVIDDCRARK